MTDEKQLAPDDENDWQPGDPCGVCGSRNTGWDPVDGGFCTDCWACDSDE